MFNPLIYFGKEVGIDLGTDNIFIYIKGRGIVVSESSVAAVNEKTGQILAVGEEAKKMLGRTPQHISVIQPVENSVISDFEISQELVRHLLKQTGSRGSFFSFPKIVIAIPSNLTEVERKSVEDVAIGAGASRAFLVESPIAAALGANLPIDEPVSNVIVDLGGGTTEIAIISMGGVVISKTLKVSGANLNESIIKFVKDEFKLSIGETTAEEIKVSIGSVMASSEKVEMPVRGRDVSSGLPREIIIRGSHVKTAINKPVKLIVESIREVIESAPPELVGDMLKQGIYLCGGGALLKGLDQMVAKETGINVFLVDEPLTCVIRGIGSIIENYAKLRYIIENPSRPKEISL